MVLHVALWRLRRPQRDALMLLVVFFTPLAVFLLMAPKFNLSFLKIFATSLLHIALSSAYILVYPASQAASPSLKVMCLVDRGMPHGLTEEEIAHQFDPGELLEARIHDLLVARLIRQNGDRLSLTAQGRAVVTPFVLLRNMLGLPAGEG